MTEDSFVGTWRLVSFELRTADGQVHYLFGQDAVGYIMYHADGFMSVAFMTADRTLFAANDPRGGSPEEKVAAMDTFFYSIRDVEEAAELCRAVGGNGVRVMADFFHMHIEQPDTPKSLAAVADVLGHVHLARRTAPPNTSVPG